MSDTQQTLKEDYQQSKYWKESVLGGRYYDEAEAEDDITMECLRRGDLEREAKRRQEEQTGR